MERARSWTELIEQLYEDSWSDDLRRFRAPYAFRGLPCLTHGLTTTLVRLAGAKGDAALLEQSLLRNFRKYAHATANGVDSIWHWLALAQHHGLPTRLIDWTYSPFVALHFATQDPNSFPHDGVVWCVNFVKAHELLPRQLRTILQRERSAALTVEMLRVFESLHDFDSLSRDPFVAFIEPPSLDDRILNQFSLFSMISNPAVGLDDWLGQHHDLIRRVVVPAELKWEVRDKLDQANINERTLFPGLDGLSRWLERYYLPR